MSATCQPARGKLRDKAKVEAGVRCAQSYILGRIRHPTFFSLGEVNAAIAIVLRRINGQVMRRQASAGRSCSRVWNGRPSSRCRRWTTSSPSGGLPGLGLDYHVEVQSFLYSVPHSLIREQVDIRIAARTIEVFHRGRRVAAQIVSLEVV